MNADEYVTSDTRYQEKAHEMSGAPNAPGMAPYPLYGLPTLGQETEAVVPFYKKPLFCYVVGGAVGIGLGYGACWMKSRMKPNPKKRRTTRKKEEAEV